MLGASLDGSKILLYTLKYTPTFKISGSQMPINKKIKIAVANFINI